MAKKLVGLKHWAFAFLMWGLPNQPAQPIAFASEFLSPERIALGWTDAEESLKKRPQPRVSALEHDATSWSFVRSLGRLEVGRANNQVQIDFQYYQTKVLRYDGGPAPLVLIYSGVGGVGILETHLAKYFARNGISSVVSAYYHESNLYDADRHNTEAYEAILASTALVDHFSSLPELAADKIAVLGISYGGLRALFHTLLDRRIKGSALMVTGASLADLLAYSTLPRAAAVRERHMASLGFTDPDVYLHYLDEHHRFRLADYAGRRKPEDFRLFISDNDPWVPTFSQWKLWEALGKPPYEAFGGGHITTPVMATFLRSHTILKFLRGQWNEAMEEFAEEEEIPAPPLDPW